jgi:AcrR family transcriptional regulator
MGRNSIVKERKANPKKRLEIVLGLVAFLKDNSLADSNMDDIASGLSKSKATIYKYFKSKEVMVDAFVDYKVARIAGFVPLLKDESIPYILRYEQSFKLLEENISEISNEFMKDLKELFPEVYQKIELLIQLAVRELSAYYSEGMKRGVFNQLNARLLSSNDFVFFQTLIDPEYLKQNNLSVAQAFKDFYDIRCKGLIPNN